VESVQEPASTIGPNVFVACDLYGHDYPSFVGPQLECGPIASGRNYIAQANWSGEARPLRAAPSKQTLAATTAFGENNVVATWPLTPYGQGDCLLDLLEIAWIHNRHRQQASFLHNAPLCLPLSRCHACPIERPVIRHTFIPSIIHP
jgi:hypothetical protein